jgi:hypothetical protein
MKRTKITRRIKRSSKKSRRHVANKKYKGGKKHIFATDNLLTAINEIKQLVIDSDIPHEICGSISQTGTNFDIYEHEAGSISGTTRANCLYEDYREPIIWHNHPKTSKYYPSIEDIQKVIKTKNSTLFKSFIFTHMGYWELTAIQHIDISPKLSLNIERLLNWFYFKSSQGRVYNKDAIDRLIKDLNTILLHNVMHIDFHLY